MNPRKSVPSGPAFTCVELLAVLAVLALLAAVTWPALAGTKPRGDRISCVNNLRQIGRAFQMWASDHRDRNPWWVSTFDGGTQGAPLRANIWFQFSWISNQLVTPRILVCPSDQAKRIAVDWSLEPGGFLNVSNRDRSVSYLIGLHATFSYPKSVLSGDHNVAVFGQGNCSAGFNNAWQISRTNPRAGWTNAVHGLTGNLLLNDGAVLQASSLGFRNALTNDYLSSFHLLTPWISP